MALISDDLPFIILRCPLISSMNSVLEGESENMMIPFGYFVLNRTFIFETAFLTDEKLFTELKEVLTMTFACWRAIFLHFFRENVSE